MRPFGFLGARLPGWLLGVAAPLRGTRTLAVSCAVSCSPSGAPRAGRRAEVPREAFGCRPWAPWGPSCWSLPWPRPRTMHSQAQRGAPVQLLFDVSAHVAQDAGAAGDGSRATGSLVTVFAVTGAATGAAAGVSHETWSSSPSLPTCASLAGI